MTGSRDARPGFLFTSVLLVHTGLRRAIIFTVTQNSVNGPPLTWTLAVDSMPITVLHLAASACELSESVSMADLCSGGKVHSL